MKCGLANVVISKVDFYNLLDIKLKRSVKGQQNGILKNWKTAVIPTIFACSLNYFLAFPTAISIPLYVIVSVFSAKFMYKNNIL